jgi:hypothetical protein
VTTEARRAQWRESKRAQFARDPDGCKARRRAYYEANADRIRERARRYYREIWKLKDAGFDPRHT